MNLILLKPEIQKFIADSTDVDVSGLALKKNPFPEIQWSEILNQVAARSKAKSKLPTWFNRPNILYPSKISIEQASSEITAKYKAGIVSGDSLIDVTGGLGVDAYYFSKKVSHVVHCEIDEELSSCVKHNAHLLGQNNIECFTGDGREILETLNRRFNWIYVDPSRRHTSKGKVFLLSDCEPDVSSLLEIYLNYTDRILIKTSPMLDLSAGFSLLSQVRKVHVVAVENEVKELLWEIELAYSGKISVMSVNICRGIMDSFSFDIGEESVAEFSEPRQYLYEPNAAIMKSGGFDHVASKFKLYKLQRNSHLYTSHEQIEFPGRVFKINSVIPYTRSEMNQISNMKANITVRNFTESVELIRKRWKINDGGERYCFFTTDFNDRKIVLICTKITKE